jgi:hypothetical protein
VRAAQASPKIYKDVLHETAPGGRADIITFYNEVCAATRRRREAALPSPHAIGAVLQRAPWPLAGLRE